MKLFQQFSRRVFVKITSILLLVSALTCFVFPSHALAYETPTYHIEHSNYVYYNYIYTYAADSLGSFAAPVWIPARQVWEYNYRITGTGASRSYGSPVNAIRVAAFEIETTYNSPQINMTPLAGDDAKGSAPESTGSQPIYENVASALVDLAIDTIAGAGVSFLWTVATLLADFHSVVDESTDTGDYIWKQWTWSSDNHDVGQFYWWIVDVKPSQVVQFSYDYYLFGPGYEMVDAGIGYHTIASPYHSMKSMGGEWNPGMMTDAEKEQNGIVAIPMSQLDEKAKEFGYAPETVKALKDSGDKFFYIATKITVYDSDSPIKE